MSTGQKTTPFISIFFSWKVGTHYSQCRTSDNHEIIRITTGYILIDYVLVEDGVAQWLGRLP